MKHGREFLKENMSCYMKQLINKLGLRVTNYFNSFGTQGCWEKLMTS